MPMKISDQLRAKIIESLCEDIGLEDITTRLLIPNKLKGKAFIEAKANGILCGLSVVKEVFRLVDSKLAFDQKQLDGPSVSQGT